MKIQLYLDIKSEKKQGYPLRLYVYLSLKDRAYTYTGYYSTKENWNFETEEPKKSHPQFNAIMDYVLEKKRIIHQIENSREKLNSRQITSKIINDDEDSENIYSFWELRIEELRSVKDNKKKPLADFYNNYLSYWKSYKNEINFSEIDYNFLTKFKIHKQKTCNAVSINIYLRAMRAIYNEAVKRGVYKPDSFISPFKGILEKEDKSKDKHLTLEEMKLVYDNPFKHNHYKYFMLMFYLGGLDFIDIASLEKKHFKNGRVKFERFKGGTYEIIDNKVFPEAQEIIDFFKSESSFILPIHKSGYKNQRDKFTTNIRTKFENIGIESYVSSKSPRYSFIHIGNKELYLNRDIIKELVGHAQGDTHSIYEGKFPTHIKDQVHKQIIDSIKTSE